MALTPRERKEFDQISVSLVKDDPAFAEKVTKPGRRMWPVSLIGAAFTHRWLLPLAWWLRGWYWMEKQRLTVKIAITAAFCLFVVAPVMAYFGGLFIQHVYVKLPRPPWF